MSNQTDNYNISLIKQAFEDLSFIPQLYVVGGAVRDYVMDNPIADIDVCSANTPEQIIKIIDKIIAEHEELRDTFSEKYPNEYQNSPDIKYYLTGIAHGTITIVANGNTYEHTTFRSDNNCDGRHAEVEYSTNIADDAARRDFTMNAIYMNKDMEIYDPYDGRKDIHNKTIKAVGVASLRIKEDYLRMIRAGRFEAKYGFSIDSELALAIGRNAHWIQNVSVERIVMEFDKAFKAPNAGKFIDFLWLWELLNYIIQEVNRLSYLDQNPQYHPEGDVLVHTIEVVDRCEPKYRWHALFHDIGKLYTAEPHKTGNWMTFYNHDKVGADKVRDICRRLKLSNKLTTEIEMVCRYHMKAYQLKRPSKLRKFVLDIKGYEEPIKAVFAADHPGNEWPELEKEPVWPTGEEIMKYYNIEQGVLVGLMFLGIKNYWIATGKLDISKGEWTDAHK